MAFRIKAPARAGGKSLSYLPIVSLLLCQWANAATYYIAPTGNDGNAGTITAPFKTLQQGVNRAVAGDTVIVRNGTYGHVNSVTGGDSSGNNYSPVVLYNSGNAQAWITIKAENKGGAILDCEMLCDSYINLLNASYIVIQDLVITRGYKEAIHSNDAAHHITLKGNRFEYIANRSTSTGLGLDGLYTSANCHDFIIDGNVFHDIGRTDANWLDHGLYLHGYNYTITNNIFYNISKGWSIQAADGLSNVLIANNTFAFPQGGGQDGQIMLWDRQTNITIQNNIFFNPRNYAITRYASTLSTCLIDRNIVYGASSMMANSTGCTVSNSRLGVNPMLVNTSTAPYDFHVNAGAPGTDGGANLAAVPGDHDGRTRPQGSNTDIGAYEYVSSTQASAPVISGVVVSGIQANSVVVSWMTDRASDSSVQYGPTGYSSATPVDPVLATQHSVTLTNLTASTLYHFRVASADTNGTGYSADGTFTTAASSGTALMFAMSAAATQLSLVPGQAVTDLVTATLTSGAAAPVSFSTLSLPAGVTAAFSSATCTVTCSTTLTLTASSSAVAGTYSIAVKGTSGATWASTAISLTISGLTTTSGLAALWDFTELSGSTAADSSGNANTGTLHGASWASNVCGGCILLDGSSGYISVSESPSLQATAQLTVSMWLRTTSKGNNDPRMVSKLYSWDVKMNGSRRYPQFSAGSMYGMLDYPLPLNQWQHVVFTYSSGVLKGYVNGALIPFAANTFTSGTLIPLQQYGLYIGTDPSRTASYKGHLDDVRIYNRVLTAAEVAALYSTTVH